MKNKYVFIGDSLTFGYGVKKSENWVNKFRENCSGEVINKGINGSTTTDMLDRFHSNVLVHKPTKAFIMGGTNDLLCNHSVSFILDNLELMVRDCKVNNIDVCLGIPPVIIPKEAEKLFMPSPNYHYCEENLIILRESIIKLCISYNLKYIDFYTLTKENLSKDIFLDGIHLNPMGQELLFQYARDFI